MNREIKVRAWDGEKFYNPILHNGLVFRNGRDFEDYIPTQDPIIQYTGLKDKNGVEIYDGDIVNSFDNINKISDPHLTNREPTFRNRAVKFKNGAFILYDAEYDFLGVIGYNGATMSEVLEVIGNIYENPELLND